MSKTTDMSGETFGRLLYLEFAGSDSKGQSRWKTLCECGTIKNVASRHRLATFSCGCMHLEIISDPATRHRKHGMYKHPHYALLRGMKTRCYNPNSHKAKWYYDKGIKICDEWLSSIEDFSRWCYENGWYEGCTIDRIDPDGNYEPSNCRFVSREENSSRVIHSRV